MQELNGSVMLFDSERIKYAKCVLFDRDLEFIQTIDMPSQF